MIRVVHPDPDFLPIPDPGVKKAPDPGSGSATLIKTENYLYYKGRTICVGYRYAVNNMNKNY